AFRTRDVLCRTADATGDVEIGRDLRAGLADLIGMRAPARRRDDARAADRAAEEAGELLDDRERLCGADAAAAADDDLRVAERDAAARVRDRLENAHRAVGVDGQLLRGDCFGRRLRVRR